MLLFSFLQLLLWGVLIIIKDAYCQNVQNVQTNFFSASALDDIPPSAAILDKLAISSEITCARGCRKLAKCFGILHNDEICILLKHDLFSGMQIDRDDVKGKCSDFLKSNMII